MPTSTDGGAAGPAVSAVGPRRANPQRFVTRPEFTQVARIVGDPAGVLDLIVDARCTSARTPRIIVGRSGAASVLGWAAAIAVAVRAHCRRRANSRVPHRAAAACALLDGRGGGGEYISELQILAVLVVVVARETENAEGGREGGGERGGVGGRERGGRLL